MLQKTGNQDVCFDAKHKKRKGKTKNEALPVQLKFRIEWSNFKHLKYWLEPVKSNDYKANGAEKK